jgi:hypothetical protein
MRIRPVIQADKSKLSPPVPEDFPLQYPRPNIQQLGEVLDAFELTPENQNRSLDVAVRPKYPSQELRVEPKEKHRVVKPKQHRATRRFFGALFSVVLTTALLHLIIINFGNHAFKGILTNSDGAKYLRGKIRFLLKTYPRTFFLEDRFQPVVGRKVVQYPPEFSDATQLYDTKSSDDILVKENMERKIFPEHETNEDCVPMSEAQKSSFRK